MIMVFRRYPMTSEIISVEIKSWIIAWNDFGYPATVLNHSAFWVSLLPRINRPLVLCGWNSSGPWILTLRRAWIYAGKQSSIILYLRTSVWSISSSCSQSISSSSNSKLIATTAEHFFFITSNCWWQQSTLSWIACSHSSSCFSKWCCNKER